MGVYPPCPCEAKHPLSPRKGNRDAHWPKGSLRFSARGVLAFCRPNITDFGKRLFSHIRLAAQTVRAPQMSGFSHNCGVKLPFFPQEKWGSLLAPRKFEFFGGWGPHAFFCPGNRSWGYRFSATTTGPNPPLAGLTTSWDGGLHPFFHPDNENTTDTELLLQP